MHPLPWEAMFPNNADVNMISTPATRPVSDIRREPTEMGLQDLEMVWLGRAPRNQASLRTTCILLKGQETQCPIPDTAMTRGANYKDFFHRVQATPAENSTLHTHFEHRWKGAGLCWCVLYFMLWSVCFCPPPSTYLF